MFSFRSYHPMNNLIYYLIVIVISMTFLDINVLFITLLSTFLLALQLLGKISALKQLKILGLIALAMVLFNLIFNHRGSHVLLKILARPITLESFILGLIMAMSLGSVLLVFTSFSEIIDHNKFLYLIGRILPKTGILTNLTIRFAKVMTKRYEEIKFVRSMNAPKDMTRKEAIKEASEQILTLIGWSAENAIVTADSMSARGYGAFKRSWYKSYGWYKRDTVFLTISLVCLIVWIFFRIQGRLVMIIYPSLVFKSMDMIDMCLYISMAIYMNIPFYLNHKKYRRI